MTKKSGNEPTVENYVLKSISKTSGKRWEYYALTRIYHRLNDPEIEFICQQCIRKPDGKLALTDMFFPQFALYLEIDEGHHFERSASDASQYERCLRDAQRTHDIALATGLTEHRIPKDSDKPVTALTLEEFNAEIDQFIELLRDLKEQAISQKTFEKWDFGKRYLAQPHIDAGHIDIAPQSAFHSHIETLKCFGANYKGHMQGSWKMPDHIVQSLGLTGRTMVWFPDLGGKKEWSNTISEDGTLIIEESKAGADHSNDWDNRIVFARSKGIFGENLYRFVGVFKPVASQSTGSVRHFERVSTRVKTYSGGA